MFELVRKNNNIIFGTFHTYKLEIEKSHFYRRPKERMEIFNNL